jgi:hypothetical protein
MMTPCWHDLGTSVHLFLQLVQYFIAARSICNVAQLGAEATVKRFDSKDPNGRVHVGVSNYLCRNHSHSAVCRQCPSHFPALHYDVL